MFLKLVWLNNRLPFSVFTCFVLGFSIAVFVCAFYVLCCQTLMEHFLFASSSHLSLSSIEHNACVSYCFILWRKH